eukprot:8754381-Pyramimonas_sp.AAC.1
MAPRMAKNSQKRLKIASTMCPSDPRTGSKTAQERPKSAPRRRPKRRCVQERPKKTAQERPKKEAQERPKKE